MRKLVAGFFGGPADGREIGLSENIEESMFYEHRVGDIVSRHRYWVVEREERKIGMGRGRPVAVAEYIVLNHVGLVEQYQVDGGK